MYIVATEDDGKQAELLAERMPGHENDKRYHRLNMERLELEAVQGCPDDRSPTSYLPCLIFKVLSRLNAADIKAKWLNA